MAVSDLDRLEHHLRARHPCVTIVTNEESEALHLVVAASLTLDRPLWRWTVLDGLTDGRISGAKPEPDTEHPAAALFHLAGQRGPLTVVTLDLADHLEDARTLRALRALLACMERDGGTLVMIDHLDRLPGAIEASATRFDLSLPDEAELERIIRRVVREEHRERPIEIDLSKRALRAIVRNLRGLTRRQAAFVLRDVVIEDRKLNEDDLNGVIARKRQLLSSGGGLEYVEAPTDMNQIGGLSVLKRWLSERSIAFEEDAPSHGLTPPRGVLLLGVQGAGKSLSAKAIATAWRQPLFRMDPSALYDRYIGESERRLRDALRQAEAMSPMVLWIDEIEKGFAGAASTSTDGGLSRRMFGTLLTWMQDHRAPVFLVATANDVEALPPELLRKGRFDEIFFVDLPGTPARRMIFEIHLKKRGRDPSAFDLDALAGASEGFSGAEIEQAVISAVTSTHARKKSLDTGALLAAVRTSPPLSVTMREKVEALRRWAKGRCVEAG
ncbi:MAG TPA: AAA family ATPase [Phycisphaerales bacterium]|nr:AAA family ATPase [Phycisphaerales bacterium]